MLKLDLTTALISIIGTSLIWIGIFLLRKKKKKSIESLVELSKSTYQELESAAKKQKELYEVLNDIT